jgi:hypothetical protein
VSIILIGRRSRHFAGVRYLRRGIDHEGNVANFVETEQIVYDINKSFDDKPVFSSFVIVRGSIPLFWTQDPNLLKGKPEIERKDIKVLIFLVLTSVDTKYLATKRHFSELFERYSYPVYCINLTKQKYMRERPLADQYMHVTNEILNRELPPGMRINYVNFDWKIKKKEGCFPINLWSTVKPFIKRTGFFTCNRIRRYDTNSQIEV